MGLSDDDAKAILKRCMFVEVRDHLIKPELRATHRDTRCSRGSMLRELAKKMRQEGDAAGLSGFPSDMWE